jgi:tryptophanyl-tRNA synthetase
LTTHPSKVDPWKVEGKMDYDRLITQFRSRQVDEALKRRTQGIAGGNLHLLFRRNVVFSHRDFDDVLTDYSAGRSFFLYTGRAPSLGMHLGHLLPFLLTKWLQEKFKVNAYVEITDDEKFLSNDDLSLDMTRKFAAENVLDIIAIGFDPERTFIFQDTEYIRNMYPLAVKIAKKLTFSQLRSTFGFDNSINPGLLFYPALQMCASMFEKKRCLIPAGIDQDPYWRLQRDVAESLGYHKAAALHLKFLPPLTGLEGKMSSSEPETAVYLTDDPKTVRRKITKHAFSGGQPTVELQRKYGGKPQVDVAFQWLYFLFERNDRRISEIQQEYESGRLLSGELKEMLAERVNAFLEEHRAKREKAKGLVSVFKSTGKLASQMKETIHE